MLSHSHVTRKIDSGHPLANMDTGAPLSDVRDRVLSANAYIGSTPIVEALRRDANVVITPWSDTKRSDAARLISSSYAGHIDSQINDQYRSPAGARRFLLNIVEYPGCGNFFTPASFVVALQRWNPEAICCSSVRLGRRSPASCSVVN